MTDFIKSKWKQARISVKVLLGLSAVGCLVLALAVMAVDTDSDGMRDAYETLFRLDANNPADSALNYDSDSLANLAEFALSTDPWEHDTDRDGWDDAEDDSPVSRLFLDWGEPLYCSGDGYDYTGPAWWISASKLNGTWETNATSWFVPSSESNDVGSLHIDIDRTGLNSDLICAISLADNSNATLYVDLYDANGLVVADDILGNLIAGTDADVVLLLEIPLESHLDAAGIRIRRGTGEIRIYSSLLYIDKDQDGLDADQEAQIGTSDALADTDYDGLSDYDEANIHATDPLLADSDGDGAWDAWEVLAGFDPLDATMRPEVTRTPIAAANSHSMMHLPDGTVLTCGNNGGGRTGQDTTTSYLSTVTRVLSAEGTGVLSNVISITTGYEFSMALMQDQGMLTWGKNGYGQLGDGSIAMRLLPVTVHGPNDLGSLSDVIAMSGGHYHSLAVRQDGRVWAWGKNGSGQLGDGTTSGEHYPIPVHGEDDQGQLGGALRVAAGYNHSAALSADGHIYTWGANGKGQLGDGTTVNRKVPGLVLCADGSAPLSNIVDVAVGNYFSAALDIDGSVWTWGYNDSGRLGDGTSTCRELPIRVHGVDDIGILTNIVAIAVGHNHTLALASDGHVYAWGAGGVGKLGDGTTANRKTPVRVLAPDGTNLLSGITAIAAGDEHSLALSGDYLLYAWGNNTEGRLGDGTTTNRKVPVLVDSDADGLSDPWEMAFFDSLAQAALDDPDSDGFSNAEELDGGTDPTTYDEDTTDTDGDGLTDAYELLHGLNPLVDDAAGDLDGDGLTNLEEFLAGTDPSRADTDGDGLSDYDEINVYGTDPLVADTDGDGMGDGTEIRHGQSPAISNSYSALPFVEAFETDTVTEGPLDNQNNWTATPTNLVQVQTNVVNTGDQAAEANTEGDGIATLSHLLAGAGADTVWIDMYLRVTPGLTPTNALEGAAIGFFNENGYLVVYDGLQSESNRWVILTNSTPLDVVSGEWARLTTKLDFAAQQWLICLNGTMVAQDLGFGVPVSEFSRLRINSSRAYADDVLITTNCPYIGELDMDADGLTNSEEDGYGTDSYDPDTDGDGMPDKWELDNGTDPLVADADADLDGDGLTNLEEYQLGTNVNDADTDNDGRSDGDEVNGPSPSDPFDPDSDDDGLLDGWEADNGTDPNIDDASSDPDNDGLTNAQEYQLGTSPNDNDSDDDGRLDGDEVNGTPATDPLDADSDNDAMPDGWEVANGLNPNSDDAGLDPDTDGLTNVEEYQAGTDPNDADSDDDGVVDGQLVNNGGGATNLAAGVSMLRGILADGPSDVSIYWGPTDGGTNPANWESRILLADTASGPFSGTISNLLYGATYFYRCHASNAVAQSWALATTNFTTFDPFAPIIVDEFTAADGTSNDGRTPSPIDQPGGNWTRSNPYWSCSLQGNALRINADAGWTVSIATSGNYTRPDRLTISADLKMGALADGGNGGGGMGLGFNATSGSSWPGFTGLVLHQGGTLVYRQDGVHVASVSWAGPAFNNDAWYHLSYDVDTSGGDLTNLRLEGSTANYSSLEAAAAGDITTNRAVYACIYGVGNAANQYGYLDNFEIHPFDTTTFEIDTLAVTGLSASAVFMNGELANVGEELPQVWLLWGTSDDWTGTWPNTEDLGVSGDGPLTRQISGLSCTDTTYYYRYCASNSTYGLVWSTPTISFGGAVDSDGDGTSDGWELANGLNPLLSDSGLDSDSDGLTGLEEFQIGTDPNDSDSDDDYMPDGLEVDNGTDPLVANMDADPDGDGLSIAQELVIGTDPLDADTDGDGTADLSLLLSLDGTDTSKRVGPWVEDGTDLAFTSEGLVRVEYEVTITNADMYVFGMEVFNANTNTTYPTTLSLRLLIDGIPGEWLSPVVMSESSTWVYSGILPYMSAGTHTIRIAWLDNFVGGELLGIKEVVLKKIDGADTDTNGTQDWVETILATGVDSDADGLADLAEIEHQPTALESLNVDTDGDTLSDYDEIHLYGTVPTLLDSDADGTNDTVLFLERACVDTSYREPTTLNNRDWYERDGMLVNYNAGARIFYDITVPNAGMHRLGLYLINYQIDMPNDYKFRVRVSINGATIGDVEVLADIDPGGHGYINTPWMNAGNHRIGLTWLNNAWDGRKGADIGFDRIRLYEINGPDSNGDGIQDWEETTLETETIDTDGDGLTDSVEVLTYGTSPVLKDTDGDGLSDSEEVAVGTDPLDPDSDDDGVSDGEELNEARTDPLVADFDGTVTDVDVVNGSETNSGVGNWVVSGTMIVAKDRRGYVEYTLTAPASDCYRILVEATHDALKATCTPVVPVDTSELMVYVDGRYMGKKSLVAPDGVFGDVRVFTPYIGPGDHTVRVFWENVHSRVSLRIRKLRLQSLGGADSDGDGVKDWVEANLGATTGLDSTRLGTDAAGLTSVVSPVCLEGPVSYIDMMSGTVGTNGVEISHGVGESWYADVDLSATGSTEVSLLFLNDAVGIVTNITWTPLDLLGAGDLILRKDDALMLNAMPEGETNGTVTIAVTEGGVSVTNLSTTLDQPVTHLFDAAGLYTVSAQFSNQNLTTNGSITVEVIGGSYPTNSPACMLGRARTWPCTNMPDGVVMESDETVDLSFTNNTMTLTMWKANGDHYAVARVSEGGAILDNTKLNPFWAQGAVDGYLWVVEQYEDSVLWENRLVFKNVPDDVDIQLRIYAGGATFDDYSIERWITNADLDANGEYTLGLIIPTGGDPYACHEVNLYQNGVLLGQAYYSGVLMPDSE